MVLQHIKVHLRIFKNDILKLLLNYPVSYYQMSTVQDMWKRETEYSSREKGDTAEERDTPSSLIVSGRMERNLFMPSLPFRNEKTSFFG